MFIFIFDPKPNARNPLYTFFVQVIQRRYDFGEPRENFNRDWADYKNGFGDPAREFWLGNENIYMLTNNEDYMLRVELEDFEGNKRYVAISKFFLKTFSSQALSTSPKLYLLINNFLRLQLRAIFTLQNSFGSRLL